MLRRRNAELQRRFGYMHTCVHEYMHAHMQACVHAYIPGSADATLSSNGASEGASPQVDSHPLPASSYLDFSDDPWAVCVHACMHACVWAPASRVFYLDFSDDPWAVCVHAH